MTNETAQVRSLLEQRAAERVSRPSALRGLDHDLGQHHPPHVHPARRLTLRLRLHACATHHRSDPRAHHDAVRQLCRRGQAADDHALASAQEHAPRRHTGRGFQRIAVAQLRQRMIRYVEAL